MLSILASNRIKVRHGLEEKFFEYFWLYMLNKSDLYLGDESNYFKLVLLLKPYKGVSEAYLKRKYIEPYLSMKARELVNRLDKGSVVSRLTSGERTAILSVLHLIPRPGYDSIALLFCLYCLFPDSEYFSSLVEKLVREILGE